jgi:hypothetical protein
LSKFDEKNDLQKKMAIAQAFTTYINTVLLVHSYCKKTYKNTFYMGLISMLRIYMTINDIPGPEAG